MRALPEFLKTAKKRSVWCGHPMNGHKKPENIYTQNSQDASTRKISCLKLNVMPFPQLLVFSA